MQIQLELFESEYEVMMREMRFMRASNEKVRKSLYARHGELQGKYDGLANRLAILERYICQRKE